MFPIRFLPQEVLVRITDGCDKLRGQTQLRVFLTGYDNAHTPTLGGLVDGPRSTCDYLVDHPCQHLLFCSTNLVVTTWRIDVDALDRPSVRVDLRTHGNRFRRRPRGSWTFCVAVP